MRRMEFCSGSSTVYASAGSGHGVCVAIFFIVLDHSAAELMMLASILMLWVITFPLNTCSNNSVPLVF